MEDLLVPTNQAYCVQNLSHHYVAAVAAEQEDSLRNHWQETPSGWRLEDLGRAAKKHDEFVSVVEAGEE